MKLATFEKTTPIGAVRRIGVVHGDQIIDLNFAYALYLTEQNDPRPYEMAGLIVPPDMIRFFEGGTASKAAATTVVAWVVERLADKVTITGARGETIVHALDEVKLLAPVPEPTNVFATMNSDRHMLNGLEKFGLGLPKAWHDTPAVYRSTNSGVAGSEDPILWPSYTEQLDYELECGIYIGKRGMNIPVERASEYIAAYTIYNDVSARDVLKKEISLYTGPAKGKCFANSNLMGPWAVTPDEVDPSNMRMVARINGEVWSEGNLNDIHWSFPQLIAHISKDEMLRPGDFISGGCIAFGSGLELDRWIQPGDVVELEIEGIGVLRNRVERRRGLDGVE
ncbi:MAG: fumarylacetoacetate hydrolase family protein [Chloroflexota bacterium]|nr:MAG: fumarylacetoacetate hydrolase family protein [Chloroflexota bacterium]